MYTNITSKQSHKSSTKFIRHSGGKVNGAIEGNIFYRDVLPDKFVWKYKGYGLDASEAEALPAFGVDLMIFREKDKENHYTGVEYSIPIEDFLSNGIRDRLGGCELQIFYPVSKMAMTSPLNIKSHALPPGGVKFKKGVQTAKQLSLYSESVNDTRHFHGYTNSI